MLLINSDSKDKVVLPWGCFWILFYRHWFWWGLETQTDWNVSWVVWVCMYQTADHKVQLASGNPLKYWKQKPIKQLLANHYNLLFTTSYYIGYCMTIAPWWIATCMGHNNWSALAQLYTVVTKLSEWPCLCSIWVRLLKIL